MPASFQSSGESATQANRFSKLPLCVDLDGTLVLSDLLHESLLLLIKRNPLYVFLVVVWLLRGRSVLKAEVAARVQPNAATLPYDHEFVRWLRAEHETGRGLWLCTASNIELAEGVAKHVGCFTGVLASDRDVNFVGKVKAQRLAQIFGERGFDYCGNERRDLAVWQRANGAIVVHGDTRLEENAARCTSVLRTFPARRRRWRAAFVAMRPQQWVKNSLVLVPLIAAHRVTEPALLGGAVLAAVAFCLCASSVYVVNDLLDLPADRTHFRKSKRPFAAGDLPLSAGVLLAPGLLIAALAVASMLPAKFSLVLATYYALTIAYSFILKGLVLVDAVTLAGLYTLRIVAGAAALDLPVSLWMLMFSIFLFQSLAFVKRFAELDMLRRQQRLRAAGRGYAVEDLSILQSMGSSGGYLSVLVLALYINSSDIRMLYAHPEMLWLLCILLLYWISRVWLKAQRGEMHDDPVIFALRDRASLFVGALAGLAVFAAI